MDGEYVVRFDSAATVVGRDTGKTRHALAGEMPLTFSTGIDGEARVSVCGLGLSGKSLRLGRKNTAQMSLSDEPAGTLLGCSPAAPQKSQRDSHCIWTGIVGKVKQQEA